MTFERLSMVKRSQHKHTVLILFAVMGFQFLTACIPLAIGTAAVTVVDLIQDRRTVGRSIDDNSLEVKLRSDINGDQHIGNSAHISVTVVNGIVLLTGEIQREDHRKRALTLARRYPETRQVVDEMFLANASGLNTRAGDSWITSKVKTKLLKTPGVPSSNIKVVTENSRVYLLGLVTRGEAERAVDIARTVRGVTHIYKIFEYIKP